MLQYTNTINLVRLAIKHQWKFIKIKKTIKSTRILNLLLKLNIVQFLCYCDKSKKDTYLVYCNLDYPKKIHTFLKPTRILAIKRKKIVKVAFKFSSESIYLTTSKGIISLKQAEIGACGGFLLFRLI